MIKVLATKSLEFSNGSEKAKTVIGFCSLPNWVQKDPYFKAAVLEGSIKTFESTSDKALEDIKKDEEKAAALKAEIEELEAKKAALLPDDDGSEKEVKEVKDVKEAKTQKEPAKK